MNRNLTPVNVYIDLSKAFDCLDHNILLSKLKFYGLSDDAIRLLQNYLLRSRTICATWKHKISTSWHLTWNSPRFGNGPTLFNILINDLNAATKKFDLIVYADDTTLVSTLEMFGNTNRPTEIENNIVTKFLKLQLGFIVIN